MGAACMHVTPCKWQQAKFDLVLIFRFFFLIHSCHHLFFYVPRYIGRLSMDLAKYLDARTYMIKLAKMHVAMHVGDLHASSLSHSAATLELHGTHVYVRPRGMHVRRSRWNIPCSVLLLCLASLPTV